MRRIALRAVVTAVVSLVVLLPAVANADATDPQDWLITGGPSGDVVPRTQKYHLVNRTNDRAVIYGERTFGINLVWGSPFGPANIRFDPVVRREGMRYERSVAIRVAGGGYLRYKSRLFGINLSWSSTPVYEWRIRGGPSGQHVHRGDSVAIYNKTEHDVVVYGVRGVGINLRWFKDVQNDANQVTTANANLAVRTGPYSSPGGCSGRVIWQLTPVSLTGSTGVATAVTVDRTFNENAENVGPGQWYCIFDATEGFLRTGTWRIQASTPVWSATCDVTLGAGANLLKPVHFTQYRSGCVNGVGWP